MLLSYRADIPHTGFLHPNASPPHKLPYYTSGLIFRARRYKKNYICVDAFVCASHRKVQHRSCVAENVCEIYFDLYCDVLVRYWKVISVDFRASIINYLGLINCSRATWTKDWLVALSNLSACTIIMDISNFSYYRIHKRGISLASNWNIVSFFKHVELFLFQFELFRLEIKFYN